MLMKDNNINIRRARGLLDEISAFSMTLKMGSYKDTWKIYYNKAGLPSTMMNCPSIVNELNTEFSEINIRDQ